MKTGDWVRVVKPYSGWLKVGDTFVVENVASGITIRMGNQSVYFSKEYFELMKFEKEEPMEFIPGKYYVHGEKDKKKHMFLGYKSNGHRVWENSSMALWTENQNYPWTEWKEPVVTYRWVCWYKENGAMQSNTQVIPRKVGERLFGMEILQVDVIKFTEE